MQRLSRIWNRSYVDEDVYDYGVYKAYPNMYRYKSGSDVSPRDPVPDRKAIVTWVTTYRQTGRTSRRRTWVPWLIRSSENIEALRTSILQSPRRYACKHASTLGLSDRSVRRIRHNDPHCHPYKMAIVQELSECEGRAFLWPFVKGFSVL